MNNKFVSDRVLKAELDRCESCLEKPCQKACPVGCSPKDFILAARGLQPTDFCRAGAMIMKQNPLGGVCGTVCTEKYCMAACSLHKTGRPVDIPAVQAAIIRRAHALGLPPLENPAKRRERVAIVGAGPAGLAAAAVLCQAGCGVCIYDAANTPGGMCRLIPHARLPEKTLRDDVDYVLSLGAAFEGGQRIDDLAPLLEAYDGIIWAAGRWNTRNFGAEGEESAMPALEFLEAGGDGLCRGKKVAIIGCGGVAVDCVSKAFDRGAETVEVFALETLSEMPLSLAEKEELFGGGLLVNLRHRVRAIEKNPEGFALCAQRVRLRGGEAFHPRSMEDVEGTAYRLEGYGLVINATGMVGARPESGGNILLAGEADIGPASVVESVASGKAAAEAMLARFNVAQSSPDETQRHALRGYIAAPVDFEVGIFGFRAENPFILSASPVADNCRMVQDAYRAGWAGAVLKTAFHNIPVKTPAAYMHCADRFSYANCDSVSPRPLTAVCRDVEQLRREFPNKLTMASTGTEMGRDDAFNRKNWLLSTRMLEDAGAMAIEYSLSCPGTDGADEHGINQNVEKTTQIAEWILSAANPDVPKLFKLTASVPSIVPFVNALRQLGERHPKAKFGITIGDTLPNLIFQDRGKTSWENGVVMGMGGQRIWSVNAFAIAGAVGRGVPVNASGGVMSYRDVANYLAMGVDFVQMCSIVMRYGYGVIDEIKSGVAHLMQSRGLRDMEALRGAARPDVVMAFDDITDVKKIPGVNRDLCARCGNCQSCHAQAVTLDADGYPVFDKERCVGCSYCTQICFAGALDMVER